MNHLRALSIGLNLAAGDDGISNRQGLGEVVLMGMEENQLNGACFIFAVHAVRRAPIGRYDVFDHP